ncbi:hypothetical protein N7G274_010176 [Stereocaulon virgatum]|uniref:Uncharacterized protein n=1 Tax=Stereocaulon virgatum TaxID=373712 RepID=A0ABR3ZU22_9LECA
MRIAQHEKILKQDEETKINCTQDYIAGDEDFLIDDSDSDIEYLGANDIQGSHQQVPEDIPRSTIPIDKGKGRALSSSSSSSLSSSGVFINNDELILDVDVELKKRSPAPLISLPQVKPESQLPSQLRAPTSAATATCGARGVERKKTKAQLEKESQDRHRTEDKVKRKEQAAERKIRKKEKMLLPRKDDVSQLAEDLFSSFLKFKTSLSYQQIYVFQYSHRPPLQRK